MTTPIAATFFCTLLASAALAAETDATGEVRWQGSLFNYDRPLRMVVEQSTPTDEQINFFLRPPQFPAASGEVKETGPARAKVVSGVDIVRLLFKDVDGDLVPALLCTPHGKSGPFPLVVAVHGLTSNKAQVCAQVAPSLIKQGYAVLAADLPCHGERPGNPFDLVNGGAIGKTFPLFRRAVVDTRQLIDLAADLPQVNVKHGVWLAGYSLGSWVSSMVGPSDPRVRAMVLMVGGAFDIPRRALLAPRVAAIDPRLAIEHFAGRPLLLLNGRTDEIVKPELSKRLFAACPQPKKQIWYDSGHLLPEQAYEDAASWIAEQAAAKAEQPRKAG